MSASHSRPLTNQLLAALPEVGLAHWWSRLDEVSLPAGRVIHEAGEATPFVVFPVSALVSLRGAAPSGEQIELALAGHDACIGAAPFTGAPTVPSQAVVLQAGAAWRLPAHLLQADVERGGPALQMVLRYSQALVAQMAQTALCNRTHGLSQRLGRWLLTAFDRVPGGELRLDARHIADTLGAGPEPVAALWATLHAQGAVESRPDHIVLRDRACLEALTCECHGALQAAHGGMHGPWTPPPPPGLARR